MPYPTLPPEFKRYNVSIQLQADYLQKVEMVFYRIPQPRICMRLRLPHYLRVPELFTAQVGGMVPTPLLAALLRAYTHQVPGGKSQKNGNRGSFDNLIYHFFTLRFYCYSMPVMKVFCVTPINTMGYIWLYPTQHWVILNCTPWITLLACCWENLIFGTFLYTSHVYPFFRPDEVLSASASNLSHLQPPNAGSGLIRRGSETSLPNIWSGSVESGIDDEGSLSIPGGIPGGRRGSRMLDFLEMKKRKPPKRVYKDKQGNFYCDNKSTLRYPNNTPIIPQFIYRFRLAPNGSW